MALLFDRERPIPMRLDPALAPDFEAMVRQPLEDTALLRKALAADLALARQGGRPDLALYERAVSTLDALLAPISRKTTPLHHRLIHTTARWFLRDPAGRSAARLRADVEVINECARVVRRPELAVPL